MSSQVEEFIPGGYPVTPQHENTLGDLENSNIENNAENDTTVDKAENKDVVNAENKDVENKTAKNDIENKTDDDIENKAKNVEQQKPKDERVDLGIKPLGNQPLPSPYKPEAEGADRSVHKQSEGAKGEMTPPGKTTAVHPESQNSGPRITKRDRINATISKAVGIFKQKLGKLIKNDDLVARGTEEKDEADKTKENAEVQKKMNEF
ncbi:hypothetical protein RhiirA5_347722 [Rhizophagus irregularis]|uniref:Uncharacterized protein n=2 Tax=Rhizophagus irregularis TaxID=588596 RepID=A0A2I1E2Y0_9GLOM|nr:hypothetical protein GLOIN_2v1621634 [Rhizophagus irregularis DAOM 181602=DAOM 197198]PKC16407.1 hypothetical protein RhiirA5_347722 [Rhizophagus irregularis]PKC71420.1 hypothetical protein RhiirA1_413209 [Rhizophagus irregularis]PKY16478.1 hypothetical protein RhiirB3_402953 [Rhizophagus irregularis]POG69998.1 hypothetical protein GLOIN_2v1621634 [Rhizophagus irregularis DAOM 181602=DAOM 197198]|eukprot:XP_025176864.1 hypothetical protein GLOIN_2v1621634 [Rhizophagus irregularis DAOM 181602=DAOM 197198]